MAHRREANGKKGKRWVDLNSERGTTEKDVSPEITSGKSRI